MRLFGFEIARVRAQARTLESVSSGGGFFGFARESFGGAWQRGIAIDTTREVLAFSAVYACVTLIASDIAKLRPMLMQEGEDGISEEVASSPYAAVLKKPNLFQNRIKFLEQWIVSKLLYGNTYALKERDDKGIVKRLYILDAARVTPLVADSGDVFYRLGRDNLSGVSEGVTVPAREIIHDMMVSLWHPLVGVSPIFACGLSATQGRRIQANSTKFFDNMSRPSGMLTAPEKITDELAARLKREWDANFTGGNLGRTAVLGEGLKYEAMTIPANDAQLIEQLKWTVEDVTRCYHVPLYKIGGPIPVGNTVEQLNVGYYSECLQAPIESFELCMDEGLAYPPAANYCTELDLSGLFRMDMATLIETEAKAVKGSIKAPNEARKALNLKPLKGGDSIYMQQQEFSLEALAKRDALPNPFVIDKPTTNPTPSATGPASTTDPEQAAANDASAKMLAELFVEGMGAASVGA